MHKFEFTPDDLFINRLKTYPEYSVFIYQSRMHVNSDTRPSGSGGLVAYDINRNLTGSNLITPFVESGSTKSVFKRQIFQPLIKTVDAGPNAHYYKNKYAATENPEIISSYSEITGDNYSSYAYESPIKRNLAIPTTELEMRYWDPTSTSVSDYTASVASINMSASSLQNVARKYSILSDHFIFSSSAHGRDLNESNINFITIPSMYYGSTIKKGSVELNYYITGSKVATCADINHNGTLIGTTGSTSGSIVGLVMYDEGIIMLTSSAQLENNSIEYEPSSPSTGSWLYYGTTLNDGTGSSNTLASASYDLNFKGTSYVNSMTMFAHARKGHLNHSNNPTYRDLSVEKINTTGSGLTFVEGSTALANVVSASYVSASFEKTTYISKVHIYDEDGNLIAITSMAKPVKKTLNDEFTFKMKLDI
jgi:hypothetical protein